MPDLKLLALDAEDLGVLAIQLQDAIVHMGEMAYVEREKRFALLCNRFDAADAPQEKRRGAGFTRRRAGLRFERVLGVKVSGIDRTNSKRFLVLLSVMYESLDGQEPEGHITLVFAGGGAVRLHVECIEAELKDLGAAWRTSRKPAHDQGE